MHLGSKEGIPHNPSSDMPSYVCVSLGWIRRKRPKLSFPLFTAPNFLARNANFPCIVKYTNKHILNLRPVLTKTLTIRDEVYKKLIEIKGDDESFSQLFERLVEKQSPKEILASLRGKIELTKSEKRNFLSELDKRREERRL